jgi:hypothetical protein
MDTSQTYGRLWITRDGDVYATTQGMGGIEKYSFHKSGICRSAFTEEHGTPDTMTDRLIFKWTRSETPPESSGKASRVAWIAFPTDYLSRPQKEFKKQITWVHAAPPGDATHLELAYTCESETSVRSAFCSGDRHLLTYTPLPQGEAFLISYYHADWVNKDLRSPKGEKSVFPDLLFSADDPDDTGHPVRIRFGPRPKDGDALVLRELGGFRETTNTA